MNYKQKFMMSEGFLLFAYAYLNTGYKGAAIVFGITTAILAVVFHSSNCLYKYRKEILVSFLLQVLVIGKLGLKGNEILTVLCLCNAIHSELWMDSSKRTLFETVYLTIGIMASFLMITLIMPDFVLQALTGRTSLTTAMYILLIFMPLILAYIYKLSYGKISRMWGTMFSNEVSGNDRLASKAIR